MRLIIVALSLFLLLMPTLTAGAQESQTVEGKGAMGETPITINFSPAGGPVTGSVNASFGGECPSTISATIDGTFDGGDGGKFTGNFNGKRVSTKCSIDVGMTGTLSGNLYANGTGRGTFKGTSSGGGTGEIPWQVTYSPQAFAAANNPTIAQTENIEIVDSEKSKIWTYAPYFLGLLGAAATGAVVFYLTKGKSKATGA